MNTVKQLAERLGVSVHTARRVIWDGRIEHVRIGRLVRITDEAINDYLKKNSMPAFDAHAKAQDIIKKVLKT